MEIQGGHRWTRMHTDEITVLIRVYPCPSVAGSKSTTADEAHRGRLRRTLRSSNSADSHIDSGCRPGLLHLIADCLEPVQVLIFEGIPELIRKPHSSEAMPTRLPTVSLPNGSADPHPRPCRDHPRFAFRNRRPKGNTRGVPTATGNQPRDWLSCESRRRQSRSARFHCRSPSLTSPIPSFWS